MDEFSNGVKISYSVWAYLEVSMETPSMPKLKVIKAVPLEKHFRKFSLQGISGDFFEFSILLSSSTISFQ